MVSNIGFLHTEAKLPDIWTLEDCCCHGKKLPFSDRSLFGGFQRLFSVGEHPSTDILEKVISANLGHLVSGIFMGSIPRTSQEGLRDFCYCTNTNNFRSSVSDFCGSDLFSCQTHLYILRLLTHVSFFQAKCSHTFSIWKGARILKKKVS